MKNGTNNLHNSSLYFMTLQGVVSVAGRHPRIYFALASSTLMISVVQEEAFLHPGSFQ
jgi:hypothetical protein